MSHEKTRPHQELCNEVPIGHAPKTVLSHGLESQFLCQEFPVDAKGVPSQRATTEGQNRNARDELYETIQIIFQRSRVGQQEMGPTDGLAALTRS